MRRESCRISCLRCFAVLLLTLPACRSNHHVSPWPQNVTLLSVAESLTIDEQFGRIESEMRNLSLSPRSEICGKCNDTELFCVREYQGVDELGSFTSAVRAATKFGIVLAVGPPSSLDTVKGESVTLVDSLSGTWKSGTDFNGDSLPDIVLRRSNARLEIWGIHSKGASPYPTDGLAFPTWGEDVDGDGRPELLGEVPTPPGDAVLPTLVEVLFFSEGRYRPDTPRSMAFHSRAAKQITLDIAARSTLASRVEFAWHRIRAREDASPAFSAIDATIKRTDISNAERLSLIRWKTWLASLNKGE